MNKIKQFLCYLGFHNWIYSFGSLDLINRTGYEWRKCKWCCKEEKVRF